jgi:hypothetical protein
LFAKKVCEFLLGLILAFGIESLWFHYWNSFRVSGFVMMRVVTCCLKSCWWKCQFVSCNSMFTMSGFIVIIRVLACCLESLCLWKCWFVVRCKPYKARFLWLLLLKVKLSQPHFEASVRMKLTFPKVGTWSPLGLPKIQRSISRVKFFCLELFVIPLKRSWSVDVQNGLTWTIWTFEAQVMVERRVGSQTGNLTPGH